ncbi:head-tail connector protein [Pseudomonas resinovorans]|uniref:Head-tail connector protein n=1 Tax=Metapseudomonas resinovorans TaxID=53412 RepID=A0ABT4Y8N3_METRE|nr:head-tail connector protein [Pseudomonas resinovorans]MDA8485158.1 head-tail connector protein [Pseudomonas resinovorans]
MMYVTLARGKQHLNTDHDEDDSLIEVYILSASRAVKNYLKSGSPFAVERDSNDNPVLDSNGAPEYVRDSNGDKVIDAAVEAAVLILLGHLYKDRDQNTENAFEQGYLPKPVTALLYPMRDPACA